MAKTGKSYKQISPSKLTAGMPEIHVVAEASEQTAILGAPVVVTAGYSTECATATAAAIYGFLESNASNGASDGAKNSRILKANAGVRFTGTLEGVLAQTQIGGVANLVVASSSWYLGTATSISSAAQCMILGPAEGFNIGDTAAVVEFVVLNDKIQGGSD